VLGHCAKARLHGATLVSTGWPSVYMIQWSNWTSFQELDQRRIVSKTYWFRSHCRQYCTGWFNSW